jgi:hypothetical protein
LEMKKERFKTCEGLKWWWPRFFDSLRQGSHCLRGGRGRRASWLASFSLRRPPRRAEMGVREIAWRRTLPRRSGGNKSAAWNAWRLLAAILTKAKYTKLCNYNCFFFVTIFRKLSGHTPRIWFRTNLILNQSDSEPTWFRTNLIPNQSDSEPIWFWTNLTLNQSDSEPIWFWTNLIPNQSDSDLIPNHLILN